MPTRDELYPSKWLKASDVDTPIVTTVDACRIEMVGQGAKGERKPVLYFRDATKPVVMNKTNFDMMITLTGQDDCDDWGGCAVELFAVDVVGPNGPTRGIRIRRPRPLKKRPAPAVVKDDIETAMPTLAEQDEEAF